MYKFSIILFEAGNTTNRYYGPVDRPFVQIGRGILRIALCAIVSDAYNVSASPQEIQRAIREGLNTIRLQCYTTVMLKKGPREGSNCRAMSTTARLLNRNLLIHPKDKARIRGKRNSL